MVCLIPVIRQVKRKGRCGISVAVFYVANHPSELRHGVAEIIISKTSHLGSRESLSEPVSVAAWLFGGRVPSAFVVNDPAKGVPLVVSPRLVDKLPCDSLDRGWIILLRRYLPLWGDLSCFVNLYRCGGRLWF